MLEFEYCFGLHKYMKNLKINYMVLCLPLFAIFFFKKKKNLPGKDFMATLATLCESKLTRIFQ